MSNHKVCIGVPFYGPQDYKWWQPLAVFTGTLHKVGIDFVGLPIAGGMMTDSNRNNIVKSFLEDTTADWLFWIDSDNDYTVAGLKRLLDINKTVVSGVYFSKKSPYNLIAYYRYPDGLYRQLTVNDYTRGEIIPINAAGCGGLLTHRSVFEDIQKDFVRLQDSKGSIRLFHKDQIKGEVSETATHPYDGQVRKGQLRERIRPLKPSLEEKAFPWFLIERGRTEDFDFFEKADLAGHKCWLDTSVEGGHLVMTKVTGEIARKAHAPKVVEKEVIDAPASA